MCKKLWEETNGFSQLSCKITKASILSQNLRLVSVNVRPPRQHKPTSWKLSDLYEFCRGDFQADAHQHTHTHTPPTLFFLPTHHLFIAPHLLSSTFSSTLYPCLFFPPSISSLISSILSPTFSCSPINSLFLDSNFSPPASPSCFLRVDCLEVITAAHVSDTFPPYLFFLLVCSGWPGHHLSLAMCWAVEVYEG